MLRFISLGILIVSLNNITIAQETSHTKAKAGVTVSGFYQTGNVETFIFRTSSDVSYSPSNSLEFKTINSYVYQAFGGDKADEDILSLNYLYISPNRKLTPLVLGFVSTNFRRQIDLRYLVGIGINYSLIKKEQSILEFSISSEYEQTDFKEANFTRSEYNDDPTISTMRGTLWIHGSYKILKDKMIINHESYYQPSLSKRNNYRWQGEIELLFPISKAVSWNINYLQTHESIVIQGQKRGDKFVTLGITIKNY